MFCMYLLFVSCHSFMYRCGIKGGGMGLGWDGRKWCCMNGISNWNCMWCVVLWYRWQAIPTWPLALHQTTHPGGVAEQFWVPQHIVRPTVSKLSDRLRLWRSKLLYPEMSLGSHQSPRGLSHENCGFVRVTHYCSTSKNCHWISAKIYCTWFPSVRNTKTPTPTPHTPCSSIAFQAAP